MDILAGLDSRGLSHASETFTQLVSTSVVRAGDTVLDIGANIGHHAAHLARIVGDSGLVHAFEPNTAHFKHLLSIPGRVRLWPLAIGDRLSIEQLHVPEGLEGWASLGDLSTMLPGRRITDVTVIQAPVDELHLPIVGTLSFIKLDVEGNEYRALMGARRAIEKYRPLIVVENADQRIVDAMASQGYAATDFFGTPLGDPRCLSGALMLPNSLLSPAGDEARQPFLDPESAAVRDVLAVALRKSRESPYGGPVARIATNGRTVIRKLLQFAGLRR